MDIMQIIVGAGAGITYSLSSFVKKKDQKFDWKKFGTTIVIGAAAGAGQGVLNMPIEGSYSYLVSLGAVPVVENAMKIFWRKLWTPFKNKYLYLTE